MPIDSNIQYYLDFMQWFEQHYPLLHDTYWSNIAIPINETIRLHHGKMEASAISEVEAVIAAYQHLQEKHKGM